MPLKLNGDRLVNNITCSNRNIFSFMKDTWKGYCPLETIELLGKKAGTG